MSHLRNIFAYKQNENVEQLKSCVEKYANCPGEDFINRCLAAVLLLCSIRSTFSTTAQNQTATRSGKLPQASQAVPFTPHKRHQLLSSGALVFPKTVLHSSVGRVGNRRKEVFTGTLSGRAGESQGRLAGLGTAHPLDDSFQSPARTSLIHLQSTKRSSWVVCRRHAL